MSKRHKKHHRTDEEEDSNAEKPGLKLVLKVGLSNQLNSSTKSTADDGSESEWHVRQKKKKKHHRHDHHHQSKPGRHDDESEDENDSDGSTSDRMSAAAKPTTDDESNHRRQLREKKYNEDEKSPLQQLLDYLQKMLQRKDSNGFFSYPVTDSIAPGYFAVISLPMDFSTMKSKIDNGIYESLQEYKTDFELMMHNCMAYNHPETIYHKEAKRLLVTGQKLMSREKMNSFRRNLPWLAGVSDADLGLDDATPESSACASPRDSRLSRKFVARPKLKNLSCGVGQFEAIPDDMTPEEILKQAQEAAQGAADKLTLREPNAKIGFLRRRNDGSTTFNILNPDNTGKVSDTERVVSLGSLVGKITSGTGVLAGVKEDKRNKAASVNYLNYGSFSSFAPTYDSSQANLNKDYSDLLISTYGDETGVDYAKSLLKFVEDSGDYAVRMVDNLLDILTGGEHSKTKFATQEEEQTDDREKEMSSKTDDITEQSTNQEVQASCSNTSAEDVIITSVYDKDGRATDDSGLQEQLNHTANLIGKLEETQYQRLSQPLPSHLTYLQPPTTEELDIATSVSAELTQLIKQTQPANVVGADSIHKVMGISEDNMSSVDRGQFDCNQPTNDLDQDLHDFFEQGTNNDVGMSDNIDFGDIDGLNNV